MCKTEQTSERTEPNPTHTTCEGLSPLSWAMLIRWSASSSVTNPSTRATRGSSSTRFTYMQWLPSTTTLAPGSLCACGCVRTHSEGYAWSVCELLKIVSLCPHAH